MMEIKSNQRYSLAQYPAKEQFEYHANKIDALIKAGIIPVAALVMSNGGCDGNELRSTYLKEDDGRKIIDQLFTEYKVNLQKDYPIAAIEHDSSDVNCMLDGYNDSLKIGYEYFGGEEEFIRDCDCNENGDEYWINPNKDFCGYNETEDRNILCIDAIETSSNPYAQQQLELIVRDFLEQLKANGVI
jgi:hypothetical protein